jgi:hypothetical protein
MPRQTTEARTAGTTYLPLLKNNIRSRVGKTLKIGVSRALKYTALLTFRC